MSKQIILMDRTRIQKAVHRIALQVWERMENEPLVIIGLNKRGFATAKKIQKVLDDLTESPITLFQFDVHAEKSIQNITDCNDAYVILVDDVIFSGKTMFEALSAVANVYQPRKIDTAVLIDRGHRKYPVLAEFTGLNVPTKMGEHIELMLKDNELHQLILFKN